MYTTSSAFLDALVEHGVEYIFANLGSDHPAFVEAIAQARATGRKIPQIITCPNEMVGMSAAHGFWQATGRPQAVMVHVECGTQALAGAIHNAAKGRAPMLIFAGSSPYTQHGEHRGSRNEFIQWIQDVHDQRGIVRGYMRYDNEIRTGGNVKELVHRAFQFANSDPQGPTYLVGPREVMEQEVEPRPDQSARWRPIDSGALTEEAVAAIGAALTQAKRPLLVTSYLGRKPEAVAALVDLCEAAGIGVLESVPNAMNFPHTSPLYLGNQWNQPVQNEHLAEADLILVVDSDVPWIPTVSHPAAGARIFHIDVDPLKEQMPLWHIEAEGVFRANAGIALGQITRWLAANPIDPVLVAERNAHFSAGHERRVARLRALERKPQGTLTPEYFVSRLALALDDDSMVFSESISNYHVVCDHLAMSRPGSIHNSGGGSLGYNGGAAVGAKLACPDKTIIALTGDGSFMFSVPSSVFWMARRYQAPILQIIFNNRGWKSPKLSALAVHPDGYASRANSLDTSFEPSPDYVGIAQAAGGAWGRKVTTADEVDAAIAEAFDAVRTRGQSAVLDVWLEHH
ncbi:MAG: thiamine pyrophosphate-requiring protein [Caulobacteraceae bacterium]|nr:thiamine pyrophosphate-requiring protein [Caulobacteraceae bacterium]